MRRRILTSMLVIPIVFGLMTGCTSKEEREKEQKKAQMGQQITEIEQMYADLQKSREELASLRTALKEAEAIPVRKRSEETKAQLAELPDRIKTLEEKTSKDYDTLQDKLATFLTTALNDFPKAPETAKGLEIYAKEALYTAEDVVKKAGDYKKAIEILQTAKTYYESIGLTPYQPLLDAMDKYDEMRFITKERFDAVKKGMTEDEVTAVAGAPYYLNKKKDEKRGIEYWLYPRRDGGAAAIYFNKKKKVYHKDFNAVKPRVVTKE